MAGTNTLSTIDMQHFFPEALVIQEIKETDDTITFYMHSKTRTCLCHKAQEMQCEGKLEKHSGSHRRVVKDISAFGKQVILVMQIYDYQCPYGKCKNKRVTETFDGFLSYRKRMTIRLEDFICSRMTESCFRGSIRMLLRERVQVSRPTIIRLLLRKYDEQVKKRCGSVAGVDDFALKKGCEYATVIVDEETHEPVAIFMGRDGEGLKAWLKKNPQVTTVTRDRAGAYTKAIEEVAPYCVQIADRFHLHQNLLVRCKKILGREIPETTAIPREPSTPIAQDVVKEDVVSVPESTKETTEVPFVNNLNATEQKRLGMILQIQEFHKEGHSLRAIAKRMNKGRDTIRKYVTGDPEKLCRSTKYSNIAPYRNFIIDSLKNGLSQSVIAQKLKELGYVGKITTARNQIRVIERQYGLSEARKAGTPEGEKISADKVKAFDYITRKGIFNHIWMQNNLTSQHKEYLWQEYKTILPELEQCVRHFREIFSRNSLACLWLFIERYKKSTIKELISFATGLEKDIESIESAVSSPLSNGFVEGVNCKIKAVKRTMYGRCRIEVLAAKLMYRPAA